MTLGVTGPRLVYRHVCSMANGRVVEILGYDGVIGIGEDGRPTRWDSLVLDHAGQVIDSSPVSASLASALVRSAQRREAAPAQ